MSADGSPSLPRPGPSFTDCVFFIPLERLANDDVGQTATHPETPLSEQSSVSTVQSTSATSTLVDPAYSAPSWSQAGFMLLQCPHLPRDLTVSGSRVAATSATPPRIFVCWGVYRNAGATMHRKTTCSQGQ